MADVINHDRKTEAMRKDLMEVYLAVYHLLEDEFDGRKTFTKCAALSAVMGSIMANCVADIVNDRGTDYLHDECARGRQIVLDLIRIDFGPQWEELVEELLD